MTGDRISTAIAQLHLIRLIDSYNLTVDEAVDKLLNDYKDEVEIGNIIIAGNLLKDLLE